MAHMPPHPAIRSRRAYVRMYNDPEYVGHAMQAWATSRGIRLEFIQPGKPQQNACIERFNRSVCYDWLAQHAPFRKVELQVSCPTLRSSRGDPFSGVRRRPDLGVLEGHQHAAVVLPRSAIKYRNT